MGNIETGFKLFDGPVKCTTGACVSSADSKIPKRKAGTQMPLFPGDETFKKSKTNTPLRSATNMEPRKEFTWLPKRMTSGSIVWFGWYWIEEYLASVDPRHMWIRRTLYRTRIFLEKNVRLNVIHLARIIISLAQRINKSS